ncbi:MAG: translation elongation factor Ts [Oscillospiraceae bacterium]|nr:translation elongation factor Ts [Oscillospiraceae bacterium]MDD7428192.1 translation elongation factor Ts [Oscillospiraceae bacterium]MDY2847140.1 translation elongation factor Ts [Oscillospiraceae bacterium]
MGKVSIAEIKDLMKSTGVGMMDCKNALTEADGDRDKAITILREKGLATQAKKSSRVAAEGIVTSVVEGNVGAVVEVNIETDFAANNDEFKAFVAAVAKTVIEQNPADLDALKAAKISGGDKSVEESLQDLFIKIRENMVIRRFTRLEGVLVPYVHGGGSIGVMVKLDTDLPADKVYEVGKNCALQVAAMNPAYLNRESVPAEVLENEKNIIMAQMAEDPKMASKPEQVRAKIAEGKVGKYYTENCLLEQAYVKDDKVSVGKYVEDSAKELGGKISVVEFVRFERGEGVEKKVDNFAEEVANMAKGNL